MITHNTIHSKIQSKNPQIWVGFTGTSPYDRDVQILHRALQQKKVHGILLFSRNIQNPKQLKRLISFLTQNSKEITVAIDQEGGKIMRLTQEKGFHHAGKMLAAADYTDISMITRIHEAAAKEMHDVGITMVLGPVADLNKNPQCPVIGLLSRSFSDNPEKVIASCNAILSAYEKYGLTGCLKHAPGHGSATTDSHSGVADITQTWSPEELRPFVQCLKSHPKTALMVGHMMQRHWDREFPSSMSKKTLHLMNTAIDQSMVRVSQIGKNNKVNRSTDITELKSKNYHPFYVADGYEMKAVSDVYTPQEFLMQCSIAGIHAVLFFCHLSNYPENYTLEKFLKEKLNIPLNLESEF